MKNLVKKISFFAGLATAVVLLAGCAPQPKAKYVFYFIGDGMSFNHILGTELYNAAKEGSEEIERINFTKFDVRGFVTNYSASHPVTDSAAAGTALATGSKTNNSYIGVDAEGNELLVLLPVAKAVPAAAESVTGCDAE